MKTLLALGFAAIFAIGALALPFTPAQALVCTKIGNTTICN
jgi:hypothetical protein